MYLLGLHDTLRLEVCPEYKGAINLQSTSNGDHQLSLQIDWQG